MSVFISLCWACKDFTRALAIFKPTCSTESRRRHWAAIVFFDNMLEDIVINSYPCPKWNWMVNLMVSQPRASERHPMLVFKRWELKTILLVINDDTLFHWLIGAHMKPSGHSRLTHLLSKDQNLSISARLRHPFLPVSAAQRRESSVYSFHRTLNCMPYSVSRCCRKRVSSLFLEWWQDLRRWIWTKHTIHC